MLSTLISLVFLFNNLLFELVNVNEDENSNNFLKNFLEDTESFLFVLLGFFCELNLFLLITYTTFYLKRIGYDRLIFITAILVGLLQTERILSILVDIFTLHFE
jgi:hypothetical protein